MTSQLSLEGVLDWLLGLRDVFVDSKEYLTQLDAAIGDADHGINMARGFSAVFDVLQQPPADIGAAFKLTSMTLIKTVGGAAGPLYGTFFLRAAAPTADKTRLDPAAVGAFFEAGIGGILQRGKAERGDKTMVDALLPALDAMKAELAGGTSGAGEPSISELIRCAVSAAEDGMKATIPLVARKGRASYLGERSKGHQDPGATSSYLMLKAAAERWS